MSLNQSYPLINQAFNNTCGCKKPQCKLCSPSFFNPFSNPYFLQYYSSFNRAKSGLGNCLNNRRDNYRDSCENPIRSICECGKRCGGKCKSACDPYLPDRPRHNKNKIVTWRVKYLVSNKLNGAAHFDEHLINPWGIVVANNEIWVANNTDDSLTSYDLHGNRLHAPVRVRDFAHNSAFPTGLVVNCDGGFATSSGRDTRSAFLITATETGTVHVYSPLVDQVRSFLVINQTLGGDVVVYKGIAIAGNYIYCADFFNNKIDVFDGNYDLQTAFPFIDGDTSNPIPPDYGPNNIAHIGCYMYVAYTKHVPDIPVHDFDGPGHGYISVFNLDGTFVRRFHSKGVLNSPWAMIPAPCECGFPKDGILIGNNGDGVINIFDCTGEFVGRILGPAGIPVIIEGLWGLATYYKCNNEIFFASAPGGNEDNEGLVGSLVVDQVLNV